MKKDSLASVLLKSFGYVALFLGLQFAASLFAEIVIALFLPAENAEMAAKMLEQTYLGLIYEITLFSELLFFGAVVLLHRGKTPELCHFRKTKPLSVVAGAVLGMGAFLATNWVLAVVFELFPQVLESAEEYMEENDLIQSASPSLWVDLLVTGFIGPLAEEVLFRGLIQNRMLRRVSLPVTLGVGALTFALIHGNLYQMVFTFPLGLLMGFLAWRFHSIWPAVAMHVCYNCSNYLIQIPQYLGLPEESVAGELVMMGITLLLQAAIPIGLILLLLAMSRQKAPEAIAPSLSQNPPVPSNGQFSSQPRANPAAFQTNMKQGESMAAPEFLVVGLGNPDAKYASTRHNCGFMALDYVALRENVKLDRLRFQALTAEREIQGKKVLLMKPQTYMNLSGKAVQQAANFYHIPPEKILVIYDDVNFKPGTFRIRKEGSAGGHNGIKSIIECLGSDAFPRVKIGVGQPPEGWDMMHWVLGQFNREETDRVVASLEDVYATVRCFTLGELDRAMQSFNGKEH